MTGTLGVTVGETIELLRYGKFRLLAFQVNIPKEDAIDVQPPYPYFKHEPAAEGTFEARYDYINLGYFYDWGETSRWNTPMVYYEIHAFGNPYKETKLIKTPEYREGYYRGNHIRRSDIENSCAVFYNKRIEVKLWNSTGGWTTPEDVFVEFTMFYYNFHDKYFPQVFDILMRNWTLLRDIKNLLYTKAGCDLGMLKPHKLEDIIRAEAESGELIKRSDLETAKKEAKL